MCNPACINFVRESLDLSQVSGKDVIEVGSLDVNGTVRPYVQSLKPYSYVGVDITSGPGVDEICDASRLCERFGESRFDVVISTEMMEHIRDWQVVTNNLKQILRPGGALVLTTRSLGFEYHGFPYDFWRYEINDMEVIWSDFLIERVVADPLSPGVFVKATKPHSFRERDLSNYGLYSMVKQQRVPQITWLDFYSFQFRYHQNRTWALLNRIPHGAFRRTRALLKI
ncbi:MAG: methyltransferase domain-containing protein [Chloroflexota bacterium]|nr:MAG: methyltransferase domain-containing protein [Chloroflexota bacterium]